MTPKELREKRAGLHSQMTALVDKARTEKRQMTAEEDEQFERIDADMKKLDGDIERADRFEARNTQMNALSLVHTEDINANNATQADAGKAHQKAYAAAFYKMLRVGVSGLDSQQQALLNGGFRGIDPQGALTPATGSGGGYIVPQGFEDILEEARKWFGGIDQFADVITTDTGNPLPWPTANDTVNTGEIIGVNTQLTQAQPSFGQVMFGGYIFSSKIVLVPLALMQDSAFNLDVWLPKQLGVRIARIQNNKFTVGVGGGTEPTGVVTAAAAAGNVVTMPTGNTASISVDNFTDLETAVDKSYRMGAKYMLNDKTLQLVKKLKDGQGRSLWLPGLASSLAGGYPNHDQRLRVRNQQRHAGPRRQQLHRGVRRLHGVQDPPRQGIHHHAADRALRGLSAGWISSRLSARTRTSSMPARTRSHSFRTAPHNPAKADFGRSGFGRSALEFP